MDKFSYFFFRVSIAAVDQLPIVYVDCCNELFSGISYIFWRVTLARVFVNLLISSRAQLPLITFKKFFIVWVCLNVESPLLNKLFFFSCLCDGCCCCSQNSATINSNREKNEWTRKPEIFGEIKKKSLSCLRLCVSKVHFKKGLLTIFDIALNKFASEEVLKFY